MILLGAYAANKVWAYFAVSGIVLGAAYLLWLYQRVFWGPITNEANRNLPDLNLRELATLVPLVILCFWIGVYPKPVLAFLHRPMAQVAAHRRSLVVVARQPNARPHLIEELADVQRMWPIADRVAEIPYLVHLACRLDHRFQCA